MTMLKQVLFTCVDCDGYDIDQMVLCDDCKSFVCLECVDNITFGLDLCETCINERLIQEEDLY